MSENGRKKWLDYARGLAMLFVILGHSLERTISLTGNTDLELFRTIVYSFNLSLFFIISGYTYALTDKRKTVKKVFLNKGIDLFLPYIIWSLFVLFGKFIFSNWVDVQVGLTDLINMFLTPVAFLWFIYTLFIIIVLVKLLDKILRKDYLVLLVLLMFFIINIFLVPRVQIVSRVTCYAFIFYIGSIVQEHEDNINLRFLGISFAVYLMFLCFHMMNLDVLCLQRLTILFGAVFFLFFSVIFQNRLNNRFVVYLGKNTMYIYILHPLVMTLIKIAIQYFSIKIEVIILFMMFVGSILFTVGITELSKRIKFIDFLFSPRKVVQMNRQSSLK